MNKETRSILPALASFVIASALLFWGGLIEKESSEVISLLVSLSVSMAGFGLVAFQIAKGSNELRHDFIETSILMIMSTVSGFFYLVFPDANLLGFNFGEFSIFVFFAALILFLFVLIDRRINGLKS